MRRLRARRPADAGMTLVELLVYSVLLIIVVGVTGSLLIRTLVTQKDVSAVTAASNEGQVAMRLLEKSLRNASDVVIPAAQNGNVLVVKTRVAEDGGDPDQWVCRAWHYNAASHQLRSIAGPATGTPVTAGIGLDGPGPVDSSTWMPVLTMAQPTPGKQIFTPDSTGAAIAFERLIDGTSTVAFASSAIPRPQGTTSGVSCI